MCEPILRGGWVGAVSDSAHGASSLRGDSGNCELVTHVPPTPSPLCRNTHTHTAGWRHRGWIKHSSFTGKKRQAAAWQSGRDCSSLLLLISIISGFRKGKKKLLRSLSFSKYESFSLTIVLTFLLMIFSPDSHGYFITFSFIFQREVHRAEVVVLLFPY